MPTETFSQTSSATIKKHMHDLSVALGKILLYRARKNIHEWAEKWLPEEDMPSFEKILEEFESHQKKSDWSVLNKTDQAMFDAAASGMKQSSDPSSKGDAALLNTLFVFLKQQVRWEGDHLDTHPVLLKEALTTLKSASALYPMGILDSGLPQELFLEDEFLADFVGRRQALVQRLENLPSSKASRVLGVVCTVNDFSMREMSRRLAELHALEAGKMPLEANEENIANAQVVLSGEERRKDWVAIIRRWDANLIDYTPRPPSRFSEDLLPKNHRHRNRFSRR